MPLHFRKKIRFPWVGITYCLGQSETNTYLIPSCLIGYQIGTHVGAQKHTPPARLSSTPTPFAGHLVGHMQYAPTLSEKDEVSLGRYYLLYRTIRDKSVFLFFIPNRLSDRYLGRAQKHTPLARLSSTLSPFAGRLVGRMQYAPTLPAEKSDFKGWRGVMFETRGDKYVFHFFMSNRLSDRDLGRGAKAYAPYRFNVYPFALCRAFGGA